MTNSSRRSRYLHAPVELREWVGHARDAAIHEAGRKGSTFDSVAVFKMLEAVFEQLAEMAEK